MEHLPPLAGRLQARRSQAADWMPMFDRFVGGLRELGVGEGAPAVGSLLPDFRLPDQRGRFVPLSRLIAEGPLVLSFHRGYWCPYCVHEVECWSGELDRLSQAGGRFAAVTPEVGGRARAFADILGPDAVTLCDVDMGLALELGLAFRLSDEVLGQYAHVGLDLSAVYGSASGFLPVPATFVVDRDRTVRYAFSDPDFRVRAEPSDVIAVVESL